MQVDCFEVHFLESRFLLKVSQLFFEVLHLAEVVIRFAVGYFTFDCLDYFLLLQI